MFNKANRSPAVVCVSAICISVIASIIAAALFLLMCVDTSTQSSVRNPIGSVVFVRHGESEWNLAKLRTGWYDAMLTDTGEIMGLRMMNHSLNYIYSGMKSAKTTGDHLNSMRIRFDYVHTSLLIRAIRTTEIILSGMPDSFNGTINKTWLLNERHFGALTGNRKTHSSWITNWDNRPPPMLPGHPYYEQIHDDPRYLDVVAENSFPNTESLADAQQRFIHLWLTTIRPQVKAGGRILIVAHQNLLRGVIKYFDQLTDAEACTLDIKNSLPFIYEFDENIRAKNKFVYLRLKSLG